jgi:hypothetical protein
MRIVASTSVSDPRFLELPDGDFELHIHYGHTEADIYKAALLVRPVPPVEAFVSLWSDAEASRDFKAIGDCLVISPGA